MMRPLRLLTVVLVLAGAFVGCEGATAIPGGAQQVHVIATRTEVHLEPATAHAGDVYLVLDLPAQGGVSLALIRSAAGVGGSLSDADLARLAQDADAEGIASESMDVSCCGNVYKETLAAGKYAFIVYDPDPAKTFVPPVSMAVLDVLP